MINQARKPKTKTVVKLSPDQLPAHCPGDNNVLWCTHPKVYVAIGTEHGDSWLCPYCGTRFEMDNPG